MMKWNKGKHARKRRFHPYVQTVHGYAAFATFMVWVFMRVPMLLPPNADLTARQRLMHLLIEYPLMHLGFAILITIGLVIKESRKVK